MSKSRSEISDIKKLFSKQLISVITIISFNLLCDIKCNVCGLARNKAEDG